MSQRRRSKKWLIVGMGGMFTLAAIFWIYAVSGFSLAYAACEGSFSLGASVARCRWPVVFGWLFWLCVASGAGFGLALLVRTISDRR